MLTAEYLKTRKVSVFLTILLFIGSVFKLFSIETGMLATIIP